jgi:hypothetical protein
MAANERRRTARDCGLCPDAARWPVVASVAQHVIGERRVIGKHVEEVVELLDGLWRPRGGRSLLKDGEGDTYRGRV